MAELLLHVQSREQSAVVRHLIEGLAGRSNFAPELVRGIKLRVAMTLLALVQDAFVSKARGGTGSDGITWKPLLPSTIAQRRTTASERKALGIGGKRERGLLTMSENKTWRKIFAQRLAWIMAKWGLGEGEAKVIAARMAWSALKNQGAKTKLEVLGGRSVEIGRDRGFLLNSLSPGLRADELPPGQILRVDEAGTITVGSNLVYAEHFHKLRPLWPSGQLPASWQRALAEALRTGIAEVVAMLGARAA